jgi:hypothetical protein
MDGGGGVMDGGGGVMEEVVEWRRWCIGGGAVKEVV